MINSSLKKFCQMQEESENPAPMDLLKSKAQSIQESEVFKFTDELDHTFSLNAASLEELKTSDAQSG